MKICGRGHFRKLGPCLAFQAGKDTRGFLTGYEIHQQSVKLVQIRFGG